MKEFRDFVAAEATNLNIFFFADYIDYLYKLFKIKTSELIY